MARNQILYELMQNEWLMNLSHLFRFREACQYSFAEKQESKKEEADLLSIYDEKMRRVFPEHVSEIPEGSVAVINAVGPMTKYWNWFSLGADEVIAQLDFANNTDQIEAIVLNVDGPGGAASAIPPFIEFSKRKKKPIVGIADAALSLHYWLINAVCDHILADNRITARFGSVGVVTHWMDFSKYFKEMGVKEMEVYPEESKHKNEIFRKIKEDEEAGKKMLVDMHLRPLAKKFQNAIKEARPNLKADEEGVLTGRTFSADNAVQNGMIDGIGSMEEALQLALSLAEMKQLSKL